ncbi:hypothetical protein ASE36_18980 [Rhizobium sp. Root274]|uniref:hypothetical protein n=1 Tax=unclassified Rhizobium TaxID=2613769 RepID=UPI0007157D03|nr:MULTISPECIES: hypothetical protein [unclassified Rhizobium]KQW27034.1 hypothetical protein ASC71_20095 [Rhizobium sp. Root1240]KRD27904.1 hypothetical protein ASE36_18980 [Rhizobium sp. Root274]
MLSLSKLFHGLLSRVAREGNDPVTWAAGHVCSPWVSRGISDGARRFGLSEGQIEEALVVGSAFEAGAVSALRLARALVTDPALRGREAEALRLAEDGLGHAEIVARLRSHEISAPAPVGSNVVNLPRRKTAAANS